MPSQFDEIIDRSGTNALAHEGFWPYLFPDRTPEPLAYPEEDLVRMWVADMSFATPPFILDAIKARVDRRILGYTRRFDPQYHQSFADWTERHYGWHCKAEHLVTANGVIPALYDLVKMICAPDEQVLFVTPSYAYFQHAVDEAHLTAVHSDLLNDNGFFRLNFSDLEAKAADPKTTLCIFCNPHNPTGRVWTPEELRRVADLIEKYDLRVISDEIHCDLLRRDQRHTPLAKVMHDDRCCITCMAPSKTFNMAGMMLSNIVIPDDALRNMWLTRQNGMENPLSLAAVQAAYTHGDAWLQDLQQYLDDNFAFTAAFLHDHLPRAVFTIPQATYLAWIDLSAYVGGIDDVTYFFAREAGVLLEADRMFVRNAEGFVRLNLACPRHILEKGLWRIAKSLSADSGMSVFPKP